MTNFWVLDATADLKDMYYAKNARFDSASSVFLELV